DAGFDEGRNATTDLRGPHTQSAGLPDLAADLVRRRVAVITVLNNTAAALAAKAATSTIPIVAGTGGDPVQAGLVASLNRPGGNITGVSAMGKADISFTFPNVCF